MFTTDGQECCGHFLMQEVQGNGDETSKDCATRRKQGECLLKKQLDYIHKVCDKMSFVKRMCKSLISKFLDYIAKTLEDENAPQTICQKLMVCKKESYEFIHEL
uniref:Saposin B-type domain-containing protein n=1 Tax=Erpetoichthys calabaricus TaxID=27687 RepID=A0A8C4T162_ERPCA